MANDGEPMVFATRSDFRTWLVANSQTSGGVWLLFAKKGPKKTLKASEALEEALCFGWIDGQMESIDKDLYKKYFALRRPNSKWSAKNKALAQALEQGGLMTEWGQNKIEEARQNGQWEAAARPVAQTEEQVAFVADVLKPYEPAHSHFLSMPPSAKRTYARAYLDAKTDEGRARRLAWMVDRLNKNLKPMG